MLYRIRALEWKPNGPDEWVARTLLGKVYVYLDFHSQWKCAAYGKLRDCDSLESGKALAEAHYHKGLLAALEPVPEKEGT